MFSAPAATYRIQLNKDFTFQDLIPVVDHIHALGVSHLYLSPVLESVEGSNHGYDAVSHGVSAERGGIDGLRALDEKARAMNPPMRIILDIVPNHMASSLKNPYWLDVLEKGRDSEFWTLFDMRTPEGGKTAVPVLGGTLDEAIAKREVRISADGTGKPVLAYADKAFPLHSRTIEALNSRIAGATDPKAALEAIEPKHVAEILDEQNYTLAHWKSVNDRIDYRRFFDVTDLIGVRVEEEENYRRTHDALVELRDQFPSIAGVRVDHVDGLADPGGYLRRLSEDFPTIWIEKILCGDEELPSDWPVEGTTGYEFIHRLNQLLVDKQGFEMIEAFWKRDIQPEWPSFDDAVAEGKALALRNLFGAELKRIVSLTAENDTDRRDAALFWTGLTLGLPVYRTYITGGAPGSVDRKRIIDASARAAALLGESYSNAAAKFLTRVLDPQSDADRQAVREWQQLSGPAKAKGDEDTAQYRYTPLTALNEVGCEVKIDHPGAAAFFDWAAQRADRWPHAMNATSTHDTKRSEDVRHRLYALAEQPDQWIAFFKAASTLNARFKTDDMPGADVEYFLYQALVGTLPLDGTTGDSYRDRIHAYMTKALKEAKRDTSWLEPNEPFEKAVHGFIDAIFGHEPFLDLLRAYTFDIARRGAVFSLSAVTLKILNHGVPDLYQGSEGWDLSLVDPDNRRPVDYAGHRTLLAGADRIKDSDGMPAMLAHLGQEWRSGAIKGWLVRQLLIIRRDHVLPMGENLRVTPVNIEGPHKDALIAYQLQGLTSDERLVVVLPARPGMLLEPETTALRLIAGGKGETVIKLEDNAATHWRELLSGQEINAGSDGVRIAPDHRFPISVFSLRP